MDQRFHVWRGVPRLQANAALYLLSFLSVVLSLPPTKPPLMDSHPFMVIWNAPTSECKRLGIPLDTTAFQAVTTPASVSGQFLTLFYSDRLGLYPHIDPLTHMQLNGGIPQKGDLTAHLLKAYNDISHYMPLESTQGLAVIDWEEWRPLWEMDGDSKDIYRKMSISYAQEEFPSLTPQQVTSVAKIQFQQAAQSYMEETMVLGITERPNQQWGFYLFPDCYNYGWVVPGYNGKCTEKTKSQNDQLLWLWESSTALYPSIYLPLTLSDSHNAALFVRNRVQEAVRVAALPKHPYTVPIYVYSRPLYKDQNTRFLSQEDLVRTIGETAALGASGSVLWGASSDYNNLVSCKALSKYLTTTLNPYIANVTAAAKLCSDVLCQGNGRCVRKNYDANDYLHLSLDYFEILQSEGYYLAVGLPSSADLKYLMDKFTCQCYAGRKCSPKLSYPTNTMLIKV